MKIDFSYLKRLEGESIIYVHMDKVKPYLVSFWKIKKRLNLFIVKNNDLIFYDFKDVAGMNMKQIIETAKNWETEE